MSQSSWKETNSRDKTFTLGLNTSITAKDITTSGTLQANKIDANEFIGTGVVDSSSSLGRVNDGSGEIIASAFAIKNYIESNYALNNLGDQSGHWIAHNEILYPSEARDNGPKGYGWKLGAYDQKNDNNGTLHFVSDVSFDRKIRAVDASFEKLGGLNGTPLEIVDNISFTGTIGHAEGVGTALEVTTDLSVNGDFRVSDASFSRVGELVSGSNVEFVSDVSFSGTIGHAGGVGNALEVTTDLSVNGDFRVSDASFARVGALVSGSNVEFVSDVSFSGTIGHAGGVGTALEVTSDLSVNGDFRVSDASFARVGELVSGSNVEFVSDVSFSGTIGHAEGVGTALEVTSDLSVNGDFRVSDASFSRVGALVSGSNVEFVSDVSFSGTIGHAGGVGNALEVTTDLSVNGAFRVSDASFARVGALVSESNVEFVSDVSFSGTIGHAGGVGTALEVTSDLSVNGDFRVSDASFARVGELVSGSNVEFVSDVSFSGTIGHAGGVGNALEVTTDLSVNGDFRVSDASFARVGELVSGSNVEFVSDVSFSGTIGHAEGVGTALEVTSDLSVNGDFRVSDASFSRVGALVSGSNVEFVSDVSFSGTIGHAGGVGNALEVTTDLSVNGDFRVSDASFAHVGALVSGSNVEFVSDVSFDGSIVAVDASFTGKVDIQSLGGNAIVSSISTGEGANDKVASISAIKNYFDSVLDISAFFYIDGDVLRPTIESSGNKIGGFDQKALVFVDDISADANLYVGGDVSLNQKLYVAGDVSFDAHLSAMDASFVRIGATTHGSSITFVDDIIADANLYVGGEVSSESLTTNINLKNWESATLPNEFSQRISVAGFGEGGLTAFGGGSAVALNNDGSKIVRGVVSEYSVCKVSVSEYIDGNWYDNTGSRLNPIGNDISGVDGELVGWSCDINSAGGRVIVGAPGFNSTAGTGRVYDYSSNANKWIQLGNDLSANDLSNNAGWSTAINAAGDVVAVGDPGFGSSAGTVRVYQYSTDNWSQLGQDSDISGTTSGELVGWSCDINAAGGRLIVGAPGFNSTAGTSRVYDYSTNANKWIQLGNDLSANDLSNNAGWSTAINAAGDVVAVGAPGFDSSAGTVRVYQYSSDNWSQLDQDSDISGDAHGSSAGSSCDINAAGNTIVVGETGTLDLSGCVKVYDYNTSADNKWSLRHSKISLVAGDYSTAISSNGRVVASGSHLPDFVLKDNPVISNVTDSTYMDYPVGVAFDSARNIAFVVGFSSDSLAVVDVSTPASPVLLGGVKDSTYMDYAIGVAFDSARNLAFVVGSNSDSLAVVDVSTPASPVLLGGVADSTYMDGAFGVAFDSARNLAYVVGYNSDSLAVVDVSTPATPMRLGGVTDSTYMDTAYGVAFDSARNIAFVVGHNSDSLAVVDVSTPASPVLLGGVTDSTYMDGAYGVAFDSARNIAFVVGASSDSLAVVDVSTPASPVLLGGVADSTYMDHAVGVAFDSARNIAFVVGASSDSLAVVDVSTPASPVLLGGVTDSTYMDGAYGVAFDSARNLAFVVSSSSESLAVVDTNQKLPETTRSFLSRDKKTISLTDAIGDIIERKLFD